MSDSTTRRFDFELEDGDELELIDHDSGEVLAAIPVDVPFGDGTAKNMRAGEDACRRVFGGHHWRQMEPRIAHEPEQRVCKLCGLIQRHVDKWVNEGDSDE